MNKSSRCDSGKNTVLSCRTVKKVGLKPKAILALSAAAFAGLNLWVSQVASAANGTDTWTSGAGDATGNWNSTANWAGSSANNPPISGDILAFGTTSGVTTLNNNLSFTTASNISSPASYSDLFEGITFSGSSAYTLGGNGITLAAPTENLSGAFTGGIITNSSSQTQNLNQSLTVAMGYDTISNTSSGTIDLSGTVTVEPGPMINFLPGSGTINTSGSGLSTSNGVLGGWAIDGDAFATLSGSNIAAYNGYTTKTASFTTVANTNYNINATNGTLKITQASGSFVDLNEIQWGGSSHGETVAANTAADPIRVGPSGAVMNTNGGSETLQIGSSNTSTFLTAGGNNTNGIGTVYLYDLNSSGGVVVGSGALNAYCIIENNGTGATTVVQDGTVNYYGNNTFSGGIYINDGDAYVDPPNNSSTTPLGSGNIYVSPGGRLDFGSDNSAKIANNIFISGFGANLNGGSNVQGGAIKLTYQGSLTGTVTLMGTASIDPNNGGNSTLPFITGQVTGTGSFMVGGSVSSGFTGGTVAMGGNQTYTGDLIIDNETNSGSGMSVKLTASNTLQNSGNVDVVGGSSGSATLDLDGSTQSINGLSSTDPVDNVAGGSADSYVTTSAPGASLTMGNGNATATFGGAIQSSVSVLKVGAGTETFSGTNTYTGTTAINGGTLLIANGGSLGASSAVTINGATLAGPLASGTGTVNDTVSIPTIGTITGGSSGGNLSIVGATTISNSAIFNVQANAASTSANSLTTTSLTLSGGSNSVTVNVSSSGALIAGDTYDLIGYSGSLGGTGFGAFTLGTLPPRVLGSLVNGTGEVQLSVSSIDFPVWTGSLDGNWTTSGSVTTGGALGSSDWVLNSNNASGTNFVAGDTPLFNDLSSVTSVNISGGNVSPGAVTFNNNNNNYTIGSTGGYGIAAGSITMNGTGSVTINTSNSYAGGTTLNAGTLNIGNAGALGSGTLTIAGGTTIDNTSGGSLTLSGNNPLAINGSFTFSGSNALNLGTGGVTVTDPTITVNNNTLTIGGNISGTSSMTKAGSGTLILGGAGSTYSGGMTVSAGTLEVAGAGGYTALGSGNATVNSGATVVGTSTDAFGYGTTGPNTIYINGGTVTDLGTSNYRITTQNLVFTGGTLTSASGNNGDGNGNFSLDGTSGNYVTTNATSSTAVISAVSIGLQNANTSNSSAILNVIAGAGTTLTDPNVTSGTPGVDLLISSKLIPFESQTLDGFTLTGGGVLALTGANTYTGNTTITNGTLQIGAGGAAGTLGTGPVVDNANLVFDRTDTSLTVSNAISGTGVVSQNGSGKTTMTSTSSTFSGGVFVNAGTLQANADSGGNSALGNGNTTVNSGGTLIAGGNDAFGFFPHNAPLLININGGTVTDLGSSSYRVTLPNLQFTGGTLTSASGNNGSSGQEYSLNGSAAGGAQITTNATTSTAVISAANIGIQNDNASNVNAVLNVAAGPGTTLSDPNVTSGTPGVDLLISSTLSPYGTQTDGVTLTNSGVVEFTGSNTYTGPTLANAGALILGNLNAVQDSTLTTNGGAIAFPSSLNTGSSVWATGGLAGTGNLTLADTSGAAITLSVGGNGTPASYSGVLSDGGASSSLLKVGAGTQTLSGANTYSGNTTVRVGTLALGSGGSINNSAVIEVDSGATLDASGAGGIAVQNGQTLGGAGTINGPVYTLAGAILQPGDPVVTTINGNLTLGASSILAYDFASPTGPTPTSAQEDVSGTLTLPAGGVGNTVTLDMTDDGGMGPGTYIIASYGELTDAGDDSFTNGESLNSYFTLGSPIPASVTGDTFNFTNDGPDNQIDLTISVPEPATLGLLSLGGMGLLARRRRRNQAT